MNNSNLYNNQSRPQSSTSQNSEKDIGISLPSSNTGDTSTYWTIKVPKFSFKSFLIFIIPVIAILFNGVLTKWFFSSQNNNKIQTKIETLEEKIDKKIGELESKIETLEEKIDKKL